MTQRDSCDDGGLLRLLMKKILVVSSEERKSTGHFCFKFLNFVLYNYLCIHSSPCVITPTAGSNLLIFQESILFFKMGFLNIYV